MRDHAETMLLVSLALFGSTGIAAVAMDRIGEEARDAPHTVVVEPNGSPYGAEAASAAAWFSEARSHCVADRVARRLEAVPAPPTSQGATYEAACLALAGDVEAARRVLQTFTPAQRRRAADVIFGVGHPVADRGEEVAVGPLMELVVEYRPNQYMALYHAGSAAYQRGDVRATRLYLERFLGVYAVADGWRSNALKMLEKLDG